MSGLFANIVQSVWLYMFQGIVTSPVSSTDRSLCSYHFDNTGMLNVLQMSQCMCEATESWRSVYSLGANIVQPLNKCCIV